MINRNIAPSLTPLSVPNLLEHRQFTLENGVEIVYINDPLQEIFKIDIVFEAGVYYQNQPLIASTTISMLNEGTHRYTAEEIADLFDFYGAYVDFNCGLNKAELSLISLTKYATETLNMLAEMILESVIPEKELEIYLTNKRQEYLINIEKTAYLSRKKFSALLFGEAHPFANQIQESDFNQITTTLVRDFYGQHIHAQNCRIIICGNVNEDILNLTSKLFNHLPLPPQINPVPEKKFHPAPPGRYHILKENSVQSSLRIGKTGIQLTHEDYAGFILLNTILGGYFGSRLMSNIREEKGYTYGIHSFNVSMPKSSYWCVTTDMNNEYTEATIEETFKEIRKLKTEKVPEAELALVKNYLHGDLLRELDGVFAQSDALKHKLNYNLDNRIYHTLIHRIRECTPEYLLELANKYWNTNEMYIVTSGKAK